MFEYQCTIRREKTYEDWDTSTSKRLEPYWHSGSSSEHGAIVTMQCKVEEMTRNPEVGGTFLAQITNGNRLVWERKLRIPRRPRKPIKFFCINDGFIYEEDTA